MGKKSGRKPKQVISPVMNAHLEESSWEPAVAPAQESITPKSLATTAPNPKSTSNGSTSGKTAQSPVGQSQKVEPPRESRLSILPYEILEKIVGRLTLVEINNLLAASDILMATALCKIIFNPEDKDGSRNREVIAVISQDNSLYAQGQLPSIYEALTSNLQEAFSGAISSVIISGSTCLLACDLLRYCTFPIPSPGEKVNRKCPLLRSVEIQNSKTFSPIALLYHVTKQKLTLGPVTFAMTGNHEDGGRWPIAGLFPFGHGTTLAVAFLYAYGAKLWRHFPSVFSRNNHFGKWLNNYTGGMFFDTKAWPLIQRSSAGQYQQPVSLYSGDTMSEAGSDDGLDDYINAPKWEGMSLERKKFAFCIAGPIFEAIGLSYEKNPDRVGRDYPCKECNQRLPEFCWQKAQLKMAQNTAGDQGSCILCRYIKDEDERDEKTMRPYKGNLVVPEPELLTLWWQHETLGCRNSSIPKKILRFRGDTVQEEEENEFCKICDEQLDKKDVDEGLCRSCQKKPAAAVESVVEDQVSNTNLVSTPMQGEGVVTGDVTQSAELPPTTSLAAEGQAGTNSPTPIEEEEGTNTEIKDFESKNSKDSDSEDTNSEGSATVTGSSRQESTSIDLDNMSMVCNASEAGDNETTSRRTLPEGFSWAKFAKFCKKSEKLAEKGVPICMYCRERLQKGEYEACEACLNLPACACCGDGIDSADDALCLRCQTCTRHCSK